MLGRAPTRDEERELAIFMLHYNNCIPQIINKKSIIMKYKLLACLIGLCIHGLEPREYAPAPTPTPAPPPPPAVVYVVVKIIEIFNKG